MVLKLCSGILALRKNILRQKNISKRKEIYAATNFENPETYFSGVSILYF